jgi:glycerol-3-phosphate O-acyltransferase/dihydroxyacetone phosphate acyltransferase
VYNKVLNKLEKGGCIGIFPEGGSHDRTELLPLKVGVALIAYTAFEKRGMNIPIVPVGLNYFQAHRFRGKAIVE